MLIDNQIMENEPQVNEESEKMREILLNKRADVEKKENIINSKKISQDNVSKLNKDKMVAEMFSIMKASGVDLNDMESISNFLTELESRDPDMKELFEYVFSSVFEEQNDSEEQENNQPDLMSKFNNLEQDILMPREPVQ